jgi:M6 family metalloprotease-like protein
MVVICVKWSNVSTTRLANGAAWVSLLNNQVNPFYNQATYNQTNFTFELPTGGPADRWFSLGHDNTQYVSVYKSGQDAIDLADAYVDWSQYNRVIVISNWQGFGGQTPSGPQWWKVSSGVEATFIESGRSVGKRLMTLSFINEWHAHDFGEPYDEAAAVAAHEIGHQLELPTHYADLHWYPGITRDVISPWDVMGYSPFQRHFLGWAKANRQWLASRFIQSVTPPADTTITLRPLERAIASGTQLIEVPFSSTSISPPPPFLGYAVENRQQVDGDERLPHSGVLVSLVDENAPYGYQDIVMDSEPSPGQILALAALQVGDSYSDAERNLRISVVSESRRSYNVRVQYPVPPSRHPDAAITRWGAPPYETADIWIDSERNGWDTYRYTDVAGNPVGNGDDAWVNHANRVYVRIRNLGPGDATNVRVQVYQNSPPGMGDAGADWQFLGSIIFPSVPAGGTPVQDYVLWTPTVGAHTCIKAIIEPIPDELNATNNQAQENVTHFDTTRGSPWEPVGLKIRVNNPSRDKQTPVHFNVQDIPDGWAVEVEPPDMVLEPGSYDWVKFMVYPSGAPGQEDQHKKEYQPGFTGKPKIEALVPFADTYLSIGGVDVWAHLVNKTELTMEAKNDKQGVTVTGKLNPPMNDAVIAVEFTAGKQRAMQFTKTNQDGGYTLSFVPPVSGTWMIQAFHDGDTLNASAESAQQKLRTRIKAPVSKVKRSTGRRRSRK